MKLNYRTLGDGDPIIILHGVFGSGDNWLTIGKELAKHFKVYLVDQRNHGLSPHGSEMNYEVMTEDLIELISDLNLSEATFLGHSMGGKTAMHFATKYTDKVSKLVVVDIGPKAYPPHHASIFRGFQSVPIDTIVSRKEAEEALSLEIPEFGVRQFILKNLARTSNGFKWKLNLSAIEKNAEQIGKALNKSAKFNGPTLFLGGSASHYILPEDHLLIKEHFPNSEVQLIDGAGHWVHAERPVELLKLVSDFLS